MQIREGRRTRYRCHTGHAYSSSALLSEVMEAVDESYWKAMRGLEEAAMLLKKQCRTAGVERRRMLQSFSTAKRRKLGAGKEAQGNRIVGQAVSGDSLLEKARKDKGS